MGNVTNDLKRMDVALCHATKGLQAKGLATRESTQAKQFATAVHSSLLWSQCHALDKLARPVRDFSSWLRACPCHERQCMDVAEFRCPWKGCRARELSSRVKRFLVELVDLRDTFATQKDAEILPALTRMLVVADLKLSWVDDLPFYIWQIDSHASAATFLKNYDASLGRHRVSVRFCEGELRKDLEAFANGRPMTDTLANELLSYQWCKIDDTWAETSHRDVSRVGQATQHVTVAWVASSLRLSQNIKLWVDTHSRERFATFFKRWKAIGQVVSSKAKLLVPRRIPRTNVIQFVYR